MSDYRQTPLDTPLARQLVAFRTECGLSQKRLARLTGIGRDRLWAYETGRRTPNDATFARLLAVLAPENLTDDRRALLQRRARLLGEVASLNAVLESENDQ